MRVYRLILSGSSEQLVLRQLDDGPYVCPICAEPSARPAWDEYFEVDPVTQLPFGCGSYIRCLCCHTEFGFHDYPGQVFKVAGVNDAWRRLRIRWLDQIGWSKDALARLRTNLEIEECDIRREASSVDESQLKTD